MERVGGEWGGSRGRWGMDGGRMFVYEVWGPEGEESLESSRGWAGLNGRERDKGTTEAPGQPYLDCIKKGV